MIADIGASSSSSVSGALHDSGSTTTTVSSSVASSAQAQDWKRRQQEQTRHHDADGCVAIERRRSDSLARAASEVVELRSSVGPRSGGAGPHTSTPIRWVDAGVGLLPRHECFDH